MANRESRLQGWADPSVPGWEQRALDAVKGRQKKSSRMHERRDGVLATFDIEFKVLLDEAAKRRGISMAGYTRRALAAFVSHDLDLPLEDVTKYMSKATNYREWGAHGRPLVRLDDDGKGFGRWVIVQLGENEESPE